MEKETIERRIDKLKESTPANFGIMTPQHMIEHLTITVRISYGKIKLNDFEPNEKQLAQKHALIYTDIEFPKGIKAPGLEENLLALRYPNLETAKSELLKSIEDYNFHFTQEPNDKTTHPRFGKLTHEEWERFHRKHFDHHLSQFEL
ncbi:DUF1569 domain-containing protein [Algoriphagus lacus]|uniref:DUF1569 domain-containing protein n=1 Tax=Algoriphagus lacus TaxID=2056311 RepID=A0A418PTR9_9BACT|nr:DUF1569 domain-containing protein [Algoriphagus lacus]RIW16972.1 DUF1569 domain-containing protein [Algoriphagus lacus]